MPEAFGRISFGGAEGSAAITPIPIAGVADNLRSGGSYEASAWLFARTGSE